MCIPIYFVNYSPCSASPYCLAWSQAANNMQILPRCNFAPASFSAILGNSEVGPKLRLACRCMLVCWSEARIGRKPTASSPGYFWATAPIGPASWQKAVQKPKISQAEPMPGWGNRAKASSDWKPHLLVNNNKYWPHLSGKLNSNILKIL